jgi:hypothetical protein
MYAIEKREQRNRSIGYVNVRASRKLARRTREWFKGERFFSVREELWRLVGGERKREAWQMTSPSAPLFFLSTCSPQSSHHINSYKQDGGRRQDEDEETETSRDTTTTTSTTDQKHIADGQSKLEDDEESTQSTGVVRLRRPNPARKGGIGFSATSRPGQNANRQSSALVPGRDPEKESIRDMTERFTGNAGQTVDVDRHMYDPFPLQELATTPS